MSKPRDIDYLLDEVVTLPSLPSTIAHITYLVNDPNTSLAEVSKVVSVDPSIALKTLRLVNSAYYGLREKVASVDHAVVLLGMKVIKNLVFTATVFDSLKSRADAFMRHSVYCGAAMRVLVEAHRGELAIEGPEEAFVFGLLHDVGKIIFEQYLPDEFAAVLKAVSQRQAPSYQIEREIIGVDHALMGARLARNWKLPEPLVNAIAGHHDLAQCEDPTIHALAGMLSVADCICLASGASAYAGAVVTVDDDLWAASGLTSQDIPPILDQFFAVLPSAEELVQTAA